MLIGNPKHDDVDGENVITDPYTVYGGYLYVFSSANGTYRNAVWLNDLSGRSELRHMKEDIESKLSIQVSEIRNCRIYKRPEVSGYTK